jgi:hypothetical protein
MVLKENMLAKYYKGETSMEEEEELKTHILSEQENSAEKDMFGYFSESKKLPDNLEESMSSAIEKEKNKGKTIRMKLYSAISAAAVVLIVVTVFLNVRSNRNAKLESEFLVMEQALSQVSGVFQPEPSEELFVLWVDDEVEIIIN